jgi:GntR family transcriptional regulator
MMKPGVPVEIVLNRTGGVPVKDQLRFQLELKILSGDVAPGEKLPSVRALARRLQLHPNTVSAAYQDLEATGHVELKRGAGVYVRPGVPHQAEQAHDLDDLVRLGLYEALSRGFSATQIRDSVDRWLAAAPPDRLVVVDRVKGMAELMAHELHLALGVAAGAWSLSEVQREPAPLAGALVACLPYHLEEMGQLAPGVRLEPVTLALADADKAAVLELPEGSRVLLVSHSTSVLPFADVLFKALRGETVTAHVAALDQPSDWRPRLATSDLVLADALAAGPLRRAQPRRLRELRLLSPDSIGRVRAALTLLLKPAH